MRKRLLGLALLLGCIAVKAWPLQAEEISEVELGEAIVAEDLGIATYAMPIVMDRTRTKEDIINMAIQLPHTGFDTDIVTAYEVVPSLTAPYSAGSLTQAAYDDALNTLKMVRYIAGLPYENVQFTPELNSYSQHGAVLLAASNQFTHHPIKPADMEEAFYQAGYTGTSEGNISTGYTNMSNVILGFIADPGMNNIELVGHRRWILAPRGQDFGIGYAQGERWNRKTVMHVFEGGSLSASTADTYVAWPSSGDFPLEYFTDALGYTSNAYCWSIGLGANYMNPVYEEVSITLIRERDGYQWVFDKNTPWLNESNVGDGTGKHFSVMPSALVFRPDSAVGSYREDDIFHVKVEGIKTSQGQATSLEYTVNFFDLSEAVFKAATTYRLDENGEAIITGYNTVYTERVLNLPETIDGIKVSGIEGPVFQDNPYIEEIYIPEGYTKVGDNVFQGCVNLRNVTLASTITEIGNSAFQNCKLLSSITLPEGLKRVGNHAFDGCNLIRIYGFPSSLVEIGEYGFANCSKLTDITIPEGTTLISKGAFLNCTDLKSITLPQSLVQIDSQAFYNTSTLSQVQIPLSVIEIQRDAFLSDDNRNITIYGVIKSTANEYADNTQMPFEGWNLFSDVIDTGWEYIPSLYVYRSGLMNGTGLDNGRVIFNPNASLTREQFAQILYNAEGTPSVTYTDRFTDVPSGQWYSNAIIWAAENGIVSGYNNGKYGVGDVITREQLAVMLYKYAQLKGKSTTGVATNVLDGFGDKAQVSDWASTQIQWAVHNKVMSGTGTNLEPKGQATRAACAAMMRNYFEGVGK